MKLKISLYKRRYSNRTNLAKLKKEEAHVTFSSGVKQTWQQKFIEIAKSLFGELVGILQKDL